jgi:hypothetical protein
MTRWKLGHKLEIIIGLFVVVTLTNDIKVTLDKGVCNTLYVMGGKMTRHSQGKKNIHLARFHN